MLVIWNRTWKSSSRASKLLDMSLEGLPATAATKLSRQILRVTRTPLSLAVIMPVLSGNLYGASGTWINPAGGSWPNPANWNSGTVADGSGYHANFTTLALSSNITVDLGGARTIGSLSFDDLAPLKHDWLLSSGTASLRDFQSRACERLSR